MSEQASAAISALVAQQVASIPDDERRRALESRLVEPRCEQLDWDYGAPGQQYSCWVIAELPERDLAFVYCEQGFGPEHPWGGVFLSKRCMGMDCQWYASLDEAFCSLAWRPARG